MHRHFRSYAVVLMLLPRFEGRLPDGAGMDDSSSDAPLLAISIDFLSTATPISWLVCVAAIAVYKLAILFTDMVVLHEQYTLRY